MFREKKLETVVIKRRNRDEDRLLYIDDALVTKVLFSVVQLFSTLVFIVVEVLPRVAKLVMFRSECEADTRLCLTPRSLPAV